MLHKEIIVKNLSGDEASVSPQELQDTIVKAVGIMSLQDKPKLISLLQSSGSLVTENNTQDEILSASFKAIRESSKFRQDLEDYLTYQASLINLEDDASSNFLNKGGKVLAWLKGVGSTVFTKENTQALIGAGIGYLGASLTAKAGKGQGDQAIAYTNAQANLEAIRLAQMQQAGITPSSGNAPTDGGGGDKGGSPKWVLPVAIIGGVLVLGTIIFFAVRRNKQ
jgi:hypothetical protein